MNRRPKFECRSWRSSVSGDEELRTGIAELARKKAGWSVGRRPEEGRPITNIKRGLRSLPPRTLSVHVMYFIDDTEIKCRSLETKIITFVNTLSM